jgi:AraC-like DNA-binding protein
MQLGARLLETTDDTVLQIALNAGHESEAAFNRAFKREFDLPPARHRIQRRPGRQRAPANQRQPGRGISFGTRSVRVPLAGHPPDPV